MCCYTINPQEPIPQRVGVRFEICVRPRLLESLLAMYRATQSGKGDDKLAFSTYIAELIEAQVIDFRSRQKQIHEIFPLPRLPEPVTPPPQRITQTSRLSDHDREQIRALLASRTESLMSQSAIARRFGVNQSTISVIAKESHSNGNGHSR